MNWGKVCERIAVKKGERRGALLFGKTVNFFVAILRHISIQEGYNLPTGAISVGAKGSGCGSVGDIVCGSPLNGRCVIGISCHVSKGIIVSDSRGGSVSI